MKFYRYIALTALAISSQLLMLSHTTAQPDTQNRILEWPDGTRYEGEVLNGQMHGEGTIYWPDGTRFEGNFTNNMRDGVGRMILPDGAEFTGVFDDNQLVREEAEPLPPAPALPEETPPEQMAQEEDPAAAMPEAETEALTEEMEVMTEEMDTSVVEAEEAEIEEEGAAEDATEATISEAIPESSVEPEPEIEIAEQQTETEEQMVQEQNLPEPAAEAMPQTAEVEAEMPEVPVPAPAPALPAEQEVEPAVEEPELAESTTEPPEEEIIVVPAPAIAGNDEPPEIQEEENQEAALKYSDELENQIVAVIDAWASAWSAQNPALYLSFYADDFAVPDGLSRAAWENQRSNRLNAPEFIQVDVGYAQFELLDNTTIEVSLRQGYTSDSYSDFTNKLMRLRREGGLWKIVGEETI